MGLYRRNHLEEVLLKGRQGFRWLFRDDGRFQMRKEALQIAVYLIGPMKEGCFPALLLKVVGIDGQGNGQAVGPRFDLL